MSCSVPASVRRPYRDLPHHIPELEHLPRANAVHRAERRWVNCTAYDPTAARPKTTTGPYGAITTYTYSNAAPEVIESTTSRNARKHRTARSPSQF